MEQADPAVAGRHHGNTVALFQRNTKGGPMPDIQSMIGKEVEVVANGMLYTGVLIEVSDVEVHLKGAFQWISLPVSAVSDMKLKAGATLHPDRSGD
jgi:hypothetical protein